MTLSLAIACVVAALWANGVRAEDDADDDVAASVLPAGTLAQSLESVGSKGDAVSADVVVRDWQRSIDLSTVRKEKKKIFFFFSHLFFFLSSSPCRFWFESSRQCCLRTTAGRRKRMCIT